MNIETRLQAHGTIRIFTIAGDRDELHGSGASRLAKFSRQLVAIHYRQADVDQRDRRLELGRHGEGARPVERNLHVVPEQAERLGESEGAIRVVVHDQNALELLGRSGRTGRVGGFRLLCSGNLAKHRQPHREAASLPQSVALHGHSPAVEPGQAAHEGQPKPQPALRAIQAAAPLNEGFEYRREELGRDSDAVIPDLGLDLTVPLSRRDGDVSSPLGVLGGVHQEIREYLRQPDRIGLDEETALGHRDRQEMRSLLEERAGHLDRPRDHGSDLGWFPSERYLAAGHARHVEEILDQAGKVHRLTSNDFTFPSRVFVPAHVHEVQCGQDWIQGIAKLVSQHREELIFPAVRLAQVLPLGPQRAIELLALGDLCLEGTGALLQLGNLAVPLFKARARVERFGREHVTMDLANPLEGLLMLLPGEMAEPVRAIELE